MASSEHKTTEDVLDAVIVQLDSQVQQSVDLILCILKNSQQPTREVAAKYRLEHLSARLSDRAKLCMEMCSALSTSCHSTHQKLERESTSCHLGNGIAKQSSLDVSRLSRDDKTQRLSRDSKLHSTSHQSVRSFLTSASGIFKSWHRSCRAEEGLVDTDEIRLQRTTSQLWDSEAIMTGSVTERMIRLIAFSTLVRAWRKWKLSVQSDRSHPRESLVTDSTRRARKAIGRTCLHLAISPVGSFFIGWSLLLAFCLLFILVVQPLEAAYLDAHFSREGRPLMVVNRIVDVIFIADIFVNFNTGYFDVKEDLVMDASKIARRYVRSWFALDFLCSVPPVIELVIIYLVARGAASSSTNTLRSAKVLKIGRVFRAIKMLRFSKLFKLADANSPFMDKLEDFASSYNFQFATKIAFIILFAFALGHIIACCMAISGDGWFETYTRDKPDRNAGDWSWQRRYLVGLYWSFTTISTVGFGDVAPASDRERIFGIIAVSAGVGFYSWIVASISSIVMANDAKSRVYYEKMDAISSWIAHHRLSRELRHRVRLHFRQHYLARTALNEKEILETLSPTLADDVAACLLSQVVQMHPLFNALPGGSLWKIVIVCKREYTQPGQVVLSHGELTSSLFILDQGLADVEVTNGNPESRQLYAVGPGASFGELAVLGMQQQSMVSVTGRTRCCFCRIQQDALLKAFRTMPGVVAKMQSRAAPTGYRIVHP